MQLKKEVGLLDTDKEGGRVLLLDTDKLNQECSLANLKRSNLCRGAVFKP